MSLREANRATKQSYYKRRLPRRRRTAARNDIGYGARGGRTLTVLPPTDFKSVASADSAIAPAFLILPYFEMLSKREALSLFMRYLLRQSLIANGR